MTGVQRDYERWAIDHPFVFAALSAVLVVVPVVLNPNHARLVPAVECGLAMFAFGVAGSYAAQRHRQRWEAAAREPSTPRPESFLPAYTAIGLVFGGMGGASGSMGFGFLLVALIPLLATMMHAVKPASTGAAWWIVEPANWAASRPLVASIVTFSLVAAVLSVSVGRVGSRIVVIAGIYGSLFGLAGFLQRRGQGHA